jgi:hypothetical protein
MLHPVRDSDKRPPDCPAKCKLKKHWVGVKFKHKDDSKPVAAAKCVIHKGGAVQHAGPLAAGELKAKDLVAATYEVSFPDIHADEWSAG